MKNRRVLTVFEALVVICIIILLVAVLLPSLSPTRGGSHRVPCISNLKAIGTMIAIYASQNKDALPPIGAFAKLQWLCDEPLGTLDIFADPMKTATISTISPAPVRKIFYCPSNPGQDPAKLNPWEGNEIWGYATLFDRSPDATQMPQDFPKREPPLGYIDMLNSVNNTADTELAFDWIISNHATGTAIDYMKTQRHGTARGT